MVKFQNFWTEQKETCIGPICCLFVLFVNLILNNNIFEKAVVVYCGKIVLWRYRIRQSNLSPQLIHAMWKWFIIFSLLFTLLKNFFFGIVIESIQIETLLLFTIRKLFIHSIIFTTTDISCIHFNLMKTHSFELHLMNNNYRLIIS